MWGDKGTLPGGPRLGRESRWIGPVGGIAFAAAVAYVSQLVFLRFGAIAFLVVLAGAFLAALYAAVSFRNLSIPFFVLILSIGGFRFLLAVETPILPDLYLDRMAMMWLFLVFMLKFVAERRMMRGPYILDVVVFLHGIYILVQVIHQDMEFFSPWVASVLIPYFAYYMAKNIVTDREGIRALLWVLLALSVYYNVTSVAEKYDINWLIWPKYIVDQAQREFAGRSQGPFMQAPLFGTVIGMILPIHLYFIATVRNKWGRGALGVSLAVGFAGLYFTYTRGSWLAGVVALAAVVVLNRRVYMRILVPALIVVPLVAIGLLGFAQDKFMKERVENEDTIGSRVGTAVTVLRVWRDHPLFGVGFFQYRNVRESYIQPVEVPGMPVIRFVQFRHNSIHDIYIGPLAETGLFGTALQFAIYFIIFRVFWLKFRHRDEKDHVAVYVLPILGGIMVGYLVGGIAFDYRFFSVVGTLFMISAGVVDGYVPELPMSNYLEGDTTARRYGQSKGYEVFSLRSDTE